MFVRLCARSCKKSKSLPSQSFTRGERKSATKVTSSVNGIRAAVTRPLKGNEGSGMVRDLRTGGGDFSSRGQGTAVGVTTSMRRGSQKRWEPDFVL